MTERTPTDFRKLYNEWSKTAPANDSDILPDRPRCENPRHAGMCTDLKAMLKWREMKESLDPLQTNYLLPGNDDDIFYEDGSATKPKRDIESEWEYRPTIGEITSAIEGVAFAVRADRIRATTTDGRKYNLREKLIPDLTAPQNECLIGFGEKYQSEVFLVELRPVVKIGRLRFSQAESSEVRPRGSLTRVGWIAPCDEHGDEKGGSASFHPPPDRIRADPLERLIAMEEAKAANDNIEARHRKALDVGIDARNFQEVGEAFGFKGKTAERKGKQLLQDAAEALSLQLERLAS